ncbi:50S ribosomal protein L2 [Candidatus Parcubacteria bacterium]|nr:50S ribosomal protein L2 [Candidatus Parcubacteria bacterium]
MKKYKPTTPGRRGMTKIESPQLNKKKPEKGLISILKKRGGRNLQGRITIRHRGGGAKRMYRHIDFSQEKINIPAKVVALEYDPNRSAFIALLEYEDKEKRYILAPQGLKVDDTIVISEKGEFKPGNRMKLKNIPIGTLVYNIEFEPGKGGLIVKGAGTTARVLAQEGGYTHLVLPSSEIRKVSMECFASIGMVSNPEYKYVKIGKAGRSRYKDRRPHVRGSAMNPVDHPHGGGEGRTGIGMKHPKTPWGKPALGVKTRKKKWTDKLIIKRRKKKKKT